jgi:peptidoglycan/xylan/chitin deacetylase (PgdA/CDA1 family)
LATLKTTPGATSVAILAAMLKQFKLLALQAAENFAAGSALSRSRWRRKRLLILCYHGVSLEDEHVWNPALYVSAGLLRERLSFLRSAGCAVLPLSEAVRRLYEGSLPARSVALTFDDGTYDFYRQALPVLEEFRFPATLYLTTSYCEYNRPVFDLMCGYLLWRGQDRVLTLPEALPAPVRLDAEGRVQAERALKAFVRRQSCSESRKDELLGALAAALAIDYAELCRKRLLHLVNLEEARELAAAGVDIQLHTHNHRISLREERFRREITENRAWIEQVSGGALRHFCYPSGYYKPEFLPWLRAAGIDSATTCEPGLAAPGCDPLLLPRLVDSSALSGCEFRGWVSGVAAWLPRRPSRINEGHLLQLMDDELDPQWLDGMQRSA